MDMKEIKKLSVEKLAEKEAALRREVMELRFDQAVGKNLDTSASRKKRKDLARVLTCKTAKEAKR